MVLITGAGGFVGRRLVMRLSASHQVRAMLRRPAGIAFPAAVQPVQADLLRPESLTAALRGIEVVIHTAALVANNREPYRGAYDQANRIGTQNLMAAAAQAGVARIVLLSGLGTHPAAPGSYMATRYGMEQAVRESGIAHVILQPSVLFGEGAEFVAALARLTQRLPVIPLLGGGRVRFQPLHVQDLLTCLDRAVHDRSLLGRSIELGGAEQLTFKEVLEAICRAQGRRRLLLPLPLWAARIPARVMSALLAHPPLTPAALELFESDNVSRLDAVESSFGFVPRAFRQHLAGFGLDA
ncbi:MAG TPA: NAD(P)H-binding protein [Candidatus Acidoferrales bacterium]|nr:NAD(P)H-binding protein [Candidatus Acidoferrales bacterium]